jgi:two-component system OmpR family response regulator/two-component system response regulator QseB
MRILVVEDDPLLADGLQAGLKQAGFDADPAQDGVEADLALTSHSYAAVLLDLGLPRLDGIALLKKLRARGDRVPVLILTARDAIEQRIQGLDSGADDYVVKPVDLGELAARLRALVRRSKGEAASILEAGELRLDPAAREVTFRGRAVELQPREFAMLQELMLNAGRVLSREQLVERLYAWGEEIESNAIEVHVHHLRRKLAPDLIRTVRGVGYLMPRARAE